MKICLIILFMLLASGAYAAPATLCVKGETAIFSCPAGKKIISICSLPDANTGKESLFYRYGESLNAVFSLAAPESGNSTDVQPHTTAVQARSLMLSGGGGAYLRFIRDGYSYIVYSAIGKGWGEKDGVAVEKEGKTLSYHSCTTEPDPNEIGGDFVDRAQIPEDADEFLLPGK